MTTPNAEGVSPEVLYQINDTLTALAGDLDVRSQFAGGDDASFDDMLQDATMAVAAIFFPFAAL